MSCLNHVSLHHVIKQLSDFNQRRFLKTLDCLNGCMSKEKKTTYDPSTYPYKLEFDETTYKISDKVKILQTGSIVINPETKVVVFDQGANKVFLFVRWISADRWCNKTQSMFIISLGDICGFMPPSGDTIAGFSDNDRRPLLEFMSRVVNKLCIDDTLSENYKLFRIIDQRWTRIKLILLGHQSSDSIISSLPFELVEMIIAFMPNWRETNWTETNKGALLRKRKAISYKETKTHSQKRKKDI
jgi:hypothetical protein